MAYYHDVMTEKSWEELQELSKTIRFVLIGGWAIYLYTKTLKSKDIDIIVDYDQLPLLQKHYAFTKNDRLKKYEARKGPVEIDIYLPHFSELGIPIVDLLKNTQRQGGFTIITPDFLLLLKLYTLLQRGRSPKGKKDFIDIMALFQLPEIVASKIQDQLRQYKLQGVWENFLAHLEEHTEVPELGLNPHQYSKIKKKILRT